MGVSWLLCILRMSYGYVQIRAGAILLNCALANIMLGNM